MAFVAWIYLFGKHIILAYQEDTRFIMWLRFQLCIGVTARSHNYMNPV